MSFAFDAFWTALKTLEESIAITSPVAMQVKRAYWGAPAQAVTDLPSVINALNASEREFGAGTRDQTLTINIQLLAARATVEDERSSRIATEFWFATQDRFDSDPRIGGTVTWSVLQGASPTVPVILQHAGQAYIGFDAVLTVHIAGAFEF